MRLCCLQKSIKVIYVVIRLIIIFLIVMRTRSRRVASEEKHKADQEQVKPKRENSKSKQVSAKKAKKETTKSQKSKSASKSVPKSQNSKQPEKVKKKKVIKKQKPAEEGYTEAQKAQYQILYDKYLAMSADALRNILAANSQTKSGKKEILAQRCADGKLLGKIPMCGTCGGGRLRFDSKTGIYHCPGYMDDNNFKNCGKKYQMSEISREPWTEP